jgi:predicted DNA-binding transcriptional regulator AlpA
MTEFIKEEAVAKIIGVAVQTLRNWRCQQRGPAYIKAGRAVRYDLEDICAFMQRKKIDPERQDSALHAEGG